MLSPENNTVFAVGSDKTLKELSNCQIVNDVPSSNKANPAEVVLTQVQKGLRGFIILLFRQPHCSGSRIIKVALSSTGRLLVVGTALGGLRSLRMPLSNPAEWVALAVRTNPPLIQFLLADRLTLTGALWISGQAATIFRRSVPFQRR